ncbi:MAG: response regulator, partial [Gammaproteobacteria bacterium]|nr:response regulator [Gammaproteobacteria bacterium]
ESAGKNLLGIINDILDFSKIEAGKLELEKCEFDLHELLSYLTTMIGFRALDNNVEVMFSIDAKVPTKVIGDSLRLNQVLTNLLANAIKFTLDGDVILHVSVLAETTTDFLLQFEVKDTGIGMSPQQLEALFKSFNQADNTISRKYGGTGLGLAICKQLIQLMSGEISVSSEQGVGSLFVFSVCLGKSDTTESSMHLKWTADPLNVLVVDDNESAREILEQIMCQFGFSVKSVSRGEKAIELLTNSEEVFDLIILDWNMPGLNGIDTLKIMKQKALSPKSQVIMCTAYGVDHLRSIKESKLADGFLQKPFSPSSLFDVIVNVASENVRERNHAATEQDQELFDQLKEISKAKILLVDDNEINQMIGEELLINQGFTPTVVGSALDAFAALTKSHFDLILMDIQMPEIDGLEATRTIRKNTKFENIPIVAMTAHAMKTDREKSIEAGMNDHLTKPIDPNELFRALVKWIPQQAMELNK